MQLPDDNNNKNTDPNTLSEISSSRRKNPKNVTDYFCVFVCYSASTANMAKLEEMERLLREAQAEKRSLLEHKVAPRIFIWLILFFYLKMKSKISLFLLILAFHQTSLPVLVVMLLAVINLKLAEQEEKTQTGALTQSYWLVQEREMDMRKQALEEERKRREELEKRLQEETSRRQKLIEREVKLREKQRAQVRNFKYCRLN